MTRKIEKPILRSKLRLKMGEFYYGQKRKQFWRQNRNLFASEINKTDLEYPIFNHESILMRKLKDVDMWYQTNKVINLKIAIKELDGIVLHPGQTMSYWKQIGKPTKRKGYVPGMVLKDGTFEAGIGGGLCQLSNLIFWMTLHTPLTVVERHRHGYDVFPDSNRTQPFGSGATCFYPYGDLMIKNETNMTFQLRLEVTKTHLKGEWRANHPLKGHYEIVERNHEMKPEYWGGYGRYNELYQLYFDEHDQLMSEIMVVKNEAIMMYAPFIDKKEEPE